MSAAQKVEHINKINKEVQGELATLQNSVSSFKWTLIVPLVGDALGFGYRAVAEMTEYDEPLSKGSLGHRAGFQTVGQVITSPIENGGLAMDWKEWSESVMAFVYRRKFSIHHSKKEEILGEHQDIVETLGYEPKDAIEYHKVKSELINSAKSRRDQVHTEELRLLRKNIDTLNEEVETYRSSESDLQSRIDQHVKDLEEARSTIHQMALDYKVSLQEAVSQAELDTSERLKSDFEQKMEAQKKLIGDLESRLGSALEELSNQESVRSEAMSELEDKINSLTSGYEGKLDLNRETIDELEALVGELRSQIGELKKSSKDSDEIISKLRADNEDLASRPLAGDEIISQIANLEANLERSSVKIQSLEATIGEKDIEIQEKDLYIQRFKKFVRAIRAQHDTELGKSKAAADEQKQRFADQTKRLVGSHRKNLKIHENLRESFDQTKSQLNSSLRQRFYLMVITIVSISIAAYTIMS